MPPDDAIAVFGASGRTGQALVAAAMASGIAVRALYRPGRVPVNVPGGLLAIPGDLQKLTDVRRTLEPTRAVVCVFGPNRKTPDAFCAAATAVILAAMAAAGVCRLVCQTGAMIGDGAGCRTWPMERLVRTFASRQPALARDRNEQEALIMSTDRDWLIIKPPRLTDRLAERLEVGPAVRVGMLSSVGRPALAKLLLAELVGPTRRTGRVFVKAQSRW